MDSLEKLNDIKNANGKKNLLCYVIEKLEKDKGKKKIDENMDLGEYDLAAKLPLNQLWIDLGEIRKGHKYILSAIQQKSNEKEDKIYDKLNNLLGKLEKIVKDLEIRIKSCESSFESSSLFLCENPKESSEKLGEKIFKFWYACRNAKRMILKEEENIKKHEENIKKLEEKQKNQDAKVNKVLHKYDVNKDTKPSKFS